MILTLLYYLDDKIQEDVMGKACIMYGVEEKCVQGLVGKSEERNPVDY